MTRVKSPKRRGFTLIELLVVLVIIALLAALAISVVGAVMTNARTAATSATLSKIDARIKDRIQTLAGLDYEAYELLATNDSRVSLNSKEEARVVAKKLAFEEAFPQTWAEFDKFYPQLATEITNKYGTNTFNAATESAEVLYYILTSGPIPGKGRRKVISGIGQTQTDEFSGADTADTDGDGLPEFVDGWGNPLRFYRWPTRLIRPTGVAGLGNPLPAADLNNAKVLMPALTATNAVQDADDPYQVLANASDPDQFEKAFHTPSTYHVPLVISTGPDEILGLSEPAPIDNSSLSHLGAITNLEAVFDNISNLNNSAGGN